MEVTLYLDIYPGIDHQFLCAYSKPGAKGATATRYRIRITLPDINKPDADAQLVSVEELPASEQADEHETASSEIGQPETR